MAISSELLFLNNFKRDLIMTFILFFYFFGEKILCEPMIIKVIACYTEKERILKELLVNVHCMFQNEHVFHEPIVL